MKIGITLTPGGLLLPYHLGVMDSLEYHGILREETPVAGSSAGAIATAAYASGLKSSKVLDLTIEMSAEASRMGGARGRLLPLLRNALDENIHEKQWMALQERVGTVGIAYREVFPLSRKVLQTSFTSPQDVINCVCYSSMFPFFSNNWPATVMRNEQGTRVPRLAVDGFFTEPRERFGAPNLNSMLEYDYGKNEDRGQAIREIVICPFPKEKIRLDAFDVQDCITAESVSTSDLFRMATEGSDREELTSLYETGCRDGEAWFARESAAAMDTVKL